MYRTPRTTPETAVVPRATTRDRHISGSRPDWARWPANDQRYAITDVDRERMRRQIKAWGTLRRAEIILARIAVALATLGISAIFALTLYLAFVRWP